MQRRPEFVDRSPTAVRHVESAYRHRFSLKEVAASYESAQEAFSRGDYLLAARYSGASRELRARALAFGGNVARAEEIFGELSELSTPGILAYAFSLWSLQKDSQAIAILERVPPNDPEYGFASELRRVIEAPEIPVFIVAAQIPVFASPDDETLRPTFRCGQFALKYVASQLQKNAYDYAPAEPFDEFLDGLPPHERPLFIYAGSPQWFLPLNFAIPGRSAWHVMSAHWKSSRSIFARATEKI
jgi:hypothetical protein